MNKLWYIDTKENHSAKTVNELLMPTRTWMNLKVVPIKPVVPQGSVYMTFPTQQNCSEGEQIVVHTYQRKLLSKNNARTTDIYKNGDES